ncbi:hypothetical protein AVEN_30188-1 [Araneus ventricosus]|uniref:Uncharacterized protein n=1 Tax=Araneus ventricosus TaxID=182803 RepID=A0A4Y2DSH4_ARAVE|nr:hypothetical protein AVEN_30188-1 [Araneus ventricosus]
MVSCWTKNRLVIREWAVGRQRQGLSVNRGGLFGCWHGPCKTFPARSNRTPFGYDLGLTSGKAFSDQFGL